MERTNLRKTPSLADVIMTLSLIATLTAITYERISKNGVLASIFPDNYPSVTGTNQTQIAKSIDIYTRTN